MLEQTGTGAEILTEQQRTGMVLSIIIPAKNEERMLAMGLPALARLREFLASEVIVVDNGSTDATVRIAREWGAVVLEHPAMTIAGLRNLGAVHAEGEVLVFLDADVMITDQWRREIANVLADLRRNGPVITGSRAGIGTDPGWIEQYWFLPMAREQKCNYMNSGHLIILKDLFLRLGGFDETLTTGEDWDLSRRAREQGVRIVNDPRLPVKHEGYPKSLLQFVRREQWHGMQDFRDFQSFVRSRPAIMASLYWLAAISGAMLSLYYRSFPYLIAALLVNSAVCAASALMKRRRYPLNLAVYFILYHAYFIARGLSLKERLVRKPCLPQP